jgi:hypothetical protein
MIILDAASKPGEDIGAYERAIPGSPGVDSARDRATPSDRERALMLGCIDKRPLADNLTAEQTELLLALPKSRQQSRLDSLSRSIARLKRVRDSMQYSPTLFGQGYERAS